jgi:putative N6-adenine-specific DNA methylase
MNLYISCASGLQQVLKKELQILGHKATIIKPTLLSIPGDEFAIAQTNLRLRTANKVYLEIAQQKVQDFDQLFDFVYAQDRAKYIDHSSFTVKAASSNSKLFSTPTIQSVSEKAMRTNLAPLSSVQQSWGKGGS